MADGDANRWDVRWVEAGAATTPEPPASFAHHLDRFPTSGRALELACGTGAAAVWLAARGMHVHAVDVSPVAVDAATTLADEHGVSERTTFAVHDLDDGLPPGEPADLILCHLFRDVRLSGAIVERLAAGGLLAIAVLSEVDAEPGPFRAAPGELVVTFAALEPIAHDEGEGRAWLLARRTSDRRP